MSPSRSQAADRRELRDPCLGVIGEQIDPLGAGDHLALDRHCRRIGIADFARGEAAGADEADIGMIAVEKIKRLGTEHALLGEPEVARAQEYRGRFGLAEHARHADRIGDHLERDRELRQGSRQDAPWSIPHRS